MSHTFTNGGEVTPQEAFTGRKPNLSKTRIFGEIGYIHLPKQSRTKLQTKANRCKFLGLTSTGYIVLDTATDKIKTSTHVKFIGVTNVETHQSQEKEDSSSGSEEIDEEDQDHDSEISPLESIQVRPQVMEESAVRTTLEVSPPTSIQAQPQVTEDIPVRTPTSIGRPSVTTEAIVPTISSYETVTPTAIPSIKSTTTPSSRTTSKIPVSQRVTRVLEPIIKNAPKQVNSEVDTANILENRMRRPKANFFAFPTFTQVPTQPTAPVTYWQATNGPDREKWIEAINQELESLGRNNTFGPLTIINQHIKPVKTRWIFKIKRDSQGNITKYKARLVAKGYTQRPGVDYDETYAPVVRLNTFRIFLVLVVFYDLTVIQLDFTTAYLNSEIDKELYVSVPEGHPARNTHRGYALPLYKGLYGLKQSGKLWNDTISDRLLLLGFKKSYSDPGFFYIATAEENTYIVLYVDDILLGSNRAERIIMVTEKLQEDFKLTVETHISSIIGTTVHFNQENSQVSIKQTAQALKLEEYSEFYYQPRSVPFKPGTTFADDTPIESNYRSLLGTLMYPMNMYRPDLAYAISRFSRYSHNPTQEQYDSLLSAASYFYHTKDLSLSFKKPERLTIDCFVDASHNSEESYSITGYVIRLGDNPVTWKSSKQHQVALSSAEAELHALVEALKELEWTRNLLSEIGIQIDEINIYEDNQACIHLATHTVVSNKTRHIMAKTKFVQDILKEGPYRIIYCPTNQMLADVLTKPLPKTPFQDSRKKMNLHDLTDLQLPGSVGSFNCKLSIPSKLADDCKKSNPNSYPCASIGHSSRDSASRNYCSYLGFFGLQDGEFGENV